MSALCMIDQAPATEGNLCSECSSKGKERVRRAPALLADVDVTTARMSRQTTGTVGRASGERALVYNVSAAEAGCELRGVLRRLAHVADERSVFRFEESDGQLVARVLGGWGAVCRSELVAVLLEGLSSASASAVRVVDSAPERRVVGVCECGAQLVTSRVEGDVVCRRCGAEWDVAEWDAYRLGSVVDQVVTAGQAAALFQRALGIRLSEATIWKWVERGQLQQVPDGDRLGVRLGDCMVTWESLHGALPGRPKAREIPRPGVS